MEGPGKAVESQRKVEERRCRTSCVQRALGSLWEAAVGRRLARPAQTLQAERCGLDKGDLRRPSIAH